MFGRYSAICPKTCGPDRRGKAFAGQLDTVARGADLADVLVALQLMGALLFPLWLPLARKLLSLGYLRRGHFESDKIPRAIGAFAALVFGFRE